MRVLTLSVLFFYSTVKLFSAPEDCKKSLEALAPLNTASAQLLADSTLRLLKMKGQLEEIRPKYVGGFNDRRVETVRVKGVPSEVRQLTEKELDSLVFRHYINGDGYFKEGRELGLIASAATSYVQISPGIERKIFEDITGIFLTLPNVTSSEVGVSSDPHSHYLNVKIPKGIPVIELEKDRIYLIPLPARYHPWVVETFEKYKRGEEIPSHLLNMCQEIESREGSRDISEILKVKLQVISGE